MRTAAFRRRQYRHPPADIGLAGDRSGAKDGRETSSTPQPLARGIRELVDRGESRLKGRLTLSRPYQE